MPARRVSNRLLTVALTASHAAAYVTALALTSAAGQDGPGAEEPLIDDRPAQDVEEIFNVASASANVGPAPAPAWSPPLVSHCTCASSDAATGDSDTGGAVADSMEVGRLADEIQDAEAILKGLRLKLDRAKEYHLKAERHLRKQIEIHQRTANATNGLTRDEEYYTRRLCALVAANEKEQLMDVCLGRKSLAFVQGIRPCLCHGGRRVSFLARSPASDLRAQLATLKGQIAEAKAKYASEPEAWSTQRVELDKEEAQLSTSKTKTYAAKQAAQNAAWLRVKEEMCAKVNSGVSSEELFKSCSDVPSTIEEKPLEEPMGE